MTRHMASSKRKDMQASGCVPVGHLVRKAASVDVHM